jgi:hypothetical protein
MSKFPVVLAMALSLAIAGYAEAAKPKKRTRNANRVGAYGAVFATSARYRGNQDANESDLRDILRNTEFPSRNITSSTKSEDLGYQAAFGYRFNRYFAAELGLAQFGELSSTARGELDTGNGFVPASVKLAFNVGGPVISGVAILPFGDKFEIYGRVGMFFASAERTLSSRLDGQSGGFGSAKGDSSNFVYAAGAAYNINQVYSLRLEYLKVGEVGQSQRTGTEELDVAQLGMLIRF